MLFDGTCNTAIFNEWLEKALCPLLNEHDVVVMDNAAFHKSPTTKALIEQTGATLLFLPPYSPDFMPIEHTFGTIKQKRKYHNHMTLDQLLNSFF